MTWITNKLLLVIMTIWTLWVCAWERADINSPYLKWFNKCWDAKENSGGVVWKEFCAIMKYLSLHYTHKHDEAEKHYKYTELVDMTPFVYRGYAEEDWDTLVNQIYMVGGNQKTTPKKSSSKQRKTNLRNQEVKNVNAPQSAIESVVELEPEQVVLQEKEEEPERPQEQPVYYEEDESAKTWVWVLLAVLIAAGAGWYFFIRDTEDTTPKDSNKTNLVEKPIDNPPVVEEVKSEPATPLAFLEDFYKGNLNDAEYIKQHVTASVLNKLKRAYESDCPSGDCLATWVFSAYPPGSDLELEEGPIITESEDGKYSVYYKYYSLGQNGKRYNPRGLLVTITKIDDKYMISDYELVMPDIVQKPSDLTEGVDGQYRLRDGRMFLHLEKEGRNIEADFNFRDGTYVSATYTFSCSIDDENKFSSAVYKMNGTHAGKIEGSLDKKVMKVDVKVDDRYSDSYEFKLE